MDFIEKRAFKRLLVKLPLLLKKLNEPKELSAVALNISEGGILFQTDVVLSVGECVELQVMTVSQSLQVRAVIVRKDQNKYGCLFLEIDDAFIDRFRYFLLTRYEL